MSLDFTLSDFSSFSIEDLQKKLQSDLRTDAYLSSWTIKTIGDKQGFMAQVLRVALDWSKESVNLPKSVVVKIPTVGKAGKAWEEAGVEGDTKDANAKVVFLMHGSECKAYNWLSVRKSEVPFPHIFYCNGDFSNPKIPPIIVMEDKSQYKIIDLISGFNRAQLFAITDAIVALHVRSILEPDDHWMEQMRWDDDEMAKNFIDMIKNMGEMLKHIRPDLFNNNNVDRIVAAFHREDFDKLLASKKIYPVMAHGDLWATNMLWDGDKLMSIIDWQLARASSTTEDLLRVLVTCVPAALRRELTPELLTYYYAKLTEKLAVEHREPPFSFADVQESYRITLPSTAAQTIFAAGMWINSPVVEGPDKPHRVDEILKRTQAVLDDALVALDKQ